MKFAIAIVVLACVSTSISAQPDPDRAQPLDPRRTNLRADRIEAKRDRQIAAQQQRFLLRDQKRQDAILARDVRNHRRLGPDTASRRSRTLD